MHPRDYARLQRMQGDVKLAECVLQEKRAALAILCEFMQERYGMTPADKVTEDLIIVRPVQSQSRD